MSVRTTILDNGVTVLTHDMPHLKTVSLGLWVGAGARNEGIEQNGIAHLLEHMAFKGTRRRSARDIAEEIETAGGDVNAATGMESTAYYARVLKEDVPLALDILADILIDPIFAAAELEREREVILEEIAAAEDTPDDLVFDLLHEVAYPDQPLGRPILGTSERIRSFTGESIAAYRDTYYAANRFVLAAAGAVDHDALADQASKALAPLGTAPTPSWSPARFSGGARTQSKPLGQAHVALGFAAPGYLHEDIYTLQILASILGGGMSSRLFQEVREKRGLCYSVFCFASAFEDTGILSVYAATGPRRLPELVSVTADELLALAETASDEEVVRARTQLKVSLVSCLESSSARADQIARQQLVFGRVPPVEELIAKVEAVDTEAVRRLAGTMFHGAVPALGAVGAIEQLAPYEKIAERFTG